MNPFPLKRNLLRDSTPLIVVTGGPGAGKTSFLDAAKKKLCEHVTLLPEAATIVFGGGFWRGKTEVSREAAQKAIYHVQRQLELISVYDSAGQVSICDRGTIDGLAYWPYDRESFFQCFGTTEEAELKRYHAVIHLSVPDETQGYNNLTNPVRNETAGEAQELGKKITDAWKNHPRRFEINSKASFEEKIADAMKILEELVPRDCGCSFPKFFQNPLQMIPNSATISPSLEG